MKTLSEQKGTSFDPRVVEVMERRYVELEAIVNSMETERKRLDIAPKMERSAVPSSGFDHPPTHPTTPDPPPRVAQ